MIKESTALINQLQSVLHEYYPEVNPTDETACPQ